MHECMHIRTHACVCVWAGVCVCSCVYVCIHVLLPAHRFIGFSLRFFWSFSVLLRARYLHFLPPCPTFCLKPIVLTAAHPIIALHIMT